MGGFKAWAREKRPPRQRVRSSRLAAEVPCSPSSKEAVPVMGHHPRLTGCLLTAWLITTPSVQTDPRRFFLPFDHHLGKITEAPISAAAAPADGMR